LQIEQTDHELHNVRAGRNRLKTVIIPHQKKEWGGKFSSLGRGKKGQTGLCRQWNGKAPVASKGRASFRNGGIRSGKQQVQRNKKTKPMGQA